MNYLILLKIYKQFTYNTVEHKRILWNWNVFLQELNTKIVPDKLPYNIQYQLIELSVLFKDYKTWIKEAKHWKCFIKLNSSNKPKANLVFAFLCDRNHSQTKYHKRSCQS